MIITIDGPSGTGKSTAAKGLAHALGITYFDTGALYRAISWQVRQAGVLLEEKEKLTALLKAFTYHVRTLDGERRYFVGDVDVTMAIRSPEITAIVSEVSALKEVREALKPIQVNVSKEMDVVFEGRDLGTVVFPHADIKFFLTARPEIRAKRRYVELQKKFPDQEFSLEKTLQDIEERDKYDSSREIAPLKQAVDAILVDTSDQTIDEVIQTMKKLVETRVKK